MGPDTPTARKLLPAKRWSPDEWEVSDSTGVIGRIVAQKLGGKTSTLHFFTGYARDPATGREYCIESSTDFEDRLAAIVRFRADPSSSVHYRQWLGRD